MKTFVRYDDPYADLNEIGQSGTLKFCFARKDGDTYHGQHVFVKCRDFLNDVVIGVDGNYTTPTIYGFRYEGDENPIDNDKTRLVMWMRSEQEYEAFKANLNKLNNMFHGAEMERTRISEINQVEGENTGYNNWYFLVEGDRKWANHVTSMSFYSLMLRVATTRVIPNDTSFAEYLREYKYHTSNDWEYLSEFNQAFTHPAQFIKNMDLLNMSDIHFSIRECDEMEYAHEQGGIMTFSKLVHMKRRGDLRDWLMEEVYYFDDDDDIESDSVVKRFPTIRDALRYA